MSVNDTVIGVVGLGYVGLPLALAMSKAFPKSIGFDVSAKKVAMLNEGKDPTEEGLEPDIAQSTLEFTTDETRLRQCDIIIVAVPTPIDVNRQPDLQPLISASELVGRNLTAGAIVVYESTVYPGVTEDVCGPVLEKVSGMKRGEGFFVGYSPERINPGDKEHTFERIVKVVAGESPAVTETVASMYETVVKAGVYRAKSIKTAEAAKVIENTQRDLNIALMNELSIIFDRMGIRTQDVLDAARTKWNFLGFSPGLVGGHCIGVDPYYLTAKAQQMGYHPQVILAGRRINDDMGTFVAERTVKLMINAGIALKGARIGIMGITFKENVSDVRNSRVPDIARELQEFGIEPLVFDPLADSFAVKEEYGIELSPLESLQDLDGIIVAVPHRSIVAINCAEMCKRIRAQGVLVDIKSIYNPEEVSEGVVYWSL
jgi:UDP-N-acetyl-D-glucosamine/UDP-N-acetyl-D-galactosamine dehydrogenase